MMGMFGETHVRRGQPDASVDGTYRHILTENDEETLNLAPLAKTDGIAELAIVAAACGSLVDREHAIFAEQVFCGSDAATAGDIK